MQFIIFLLGLFTIGCVLYGISSGVQMIQRGLTYLAEGTREESPPKKPLVIPRPSATEKVVDTPAARQKTTTPTGMHASPVQHSIGELQDIFALYQQGALAQHEFESMKQHLLTAIKATAP